MSRLACCLSAALALLISGCSGNGWVTTGVSVNNLNVLDTQATQYHFNNPNGWALGNEFGDQIQGAYGRNALKFESEDVFEFMCAAGTIDPAIEGLVYDPENWSQTPDAEKHDPGTAMMEFVTLARTCKPNAKVMLTPARDLVAYPDALCKQQPGENRDEAFLRCGIMRQAAEAHPDAIQFQSQVHECDPALYRSTLVNAKQQAKDAYPGLPYFLGGLASSPSATGTCGSSLPTAAQLIAAYDNSKDVTDGYFITINTGEEAGVLGLLQELRSRNE